MNPRPNFYITRENFQTLIGPGYWRIQDLPGKRAEQVRGFLDSCDTIGVFASGVAPQGIEDPDPVGGIDWVRLESRPLEGEPPLNFYHYVIRTPDSSGYPVYGPFKDGAIAPHWGDLKDIDRY